jgi:hypothetical protein
MRDQITTASKRRLQRWLGALGKGHLAAVGRIVRLQLDLRPQRRLRHPRRQVRAGALLRCSATITMD